VRGILNQHINELGSKKVSLSFKAIYILPYGPLHPFQRSRQHYSVFHQEAQ